MNNLNNVKDKTIKQTEELGENVKEKASSTYNDIKNHAESMVHQVKEKTADLYEEGKHKVSDIQESAIDYADDFVQNIKDKPLTSVLIAAGVGYVMSLLLRK
ncbi:MAG: DUF883 domain-containing protein [Tatlockia sp.]|nr:DUF883 domain-containing protein [Tatlockia sp.]